MRRNSTCGNVLVALSTAESGMELRSSSSTVNRPVMDTKWIDSCMDGGVLWGTARQRTAIKQRSFGQR
jgi:hypothetical protein